MSQHDMNIGNQLFPATRADINTALVALASTSSGATAPSSAVANQIWYDTSANILRIYNEAGSAWIDLCTLDQSSNKVQSITTVGLTLGATALTVTGSELNKLAGASVTTTELDQISAITRGSIIYGNASGTARLAKGTSGQVLTATATDITWAAAPAPAVAAITSDGTTPSLNTNITAGEIRNLIGAGTGNSDSDTVYSIQDGELSENNFTNADHSKLNGIATGATVDQTNAEIRAAIEAATDSNVFTDADHTKLGNIENQTDAEIRAAVEAAADSNVFTDTDHTKLNGIAASANNYTHPNHSGEVTSSADGATVIAGNVVDEANLKVSNNPTNGYVLTAQSANAGGLTWAAGGSLTLVSAVATTSGSAIDLSGIPSGVNRVTLNLVNVGLSVSTFMLVQLGDSGGIETSGYIASSGHNSDGGYYNTTGFPIIRTITSNFTSGIMTLTRATGNEWVSSHAATRDTAGTGAFGGGSKTLSGELTQLRLTKPSLGSFNQGKISISYE